MKKILSFLFAVLILSSCRFSRSPKNGLIEGLYSQKTGNETRLIFIEIKDEVLLIHPALKSRGKVSIDTTKAVSFYKNEEKNDSEEEVSFRKNTLDIDFLTMPLKYRPIQKDIPPQLNANLNGAVYLGFRTDKYNVSYLTNPLKRSQRLINHYGFSSGIFTGFGNTTINQTNTQVSIDYDGIVWNKGIAGIFAINNFTLGLSVGFDNLLDKNRASWIYESKPWFGFAFGLNLN